MKNLIAHKKHAIFIIILALFINIPSSYAQSTKMTIACFDLYKASPEVAFDMSYNTKTTLLCDVKRTLKQAKTPIEQIAFNLNRKIAALRQLVPPEKQRYLQRLYKSFCSAGVYEYDILTDKAGVIYADNSTQDILKNNDLTDLICSDRIATNNRTDKLKASIAKIGYIDSLSSGYSYGKSSEEEWAYLLYGKKSKIRRDSDSLYDSFLSLMTDTYGWQNDILLHNRNQISEESKVWCQIAENENNRQQEIRLAVEKIAKAKGISLVLDIRRVWTGTDELKKNGIYIVIPDKPNSEELKKQSANDVW